MVVDERRDEIIAMIIARLHPQSNLHTIPQNSRARTRSRTYTPGFEGGKDIVQRWKSGDTKGIVVGWARQGQQAERKAAHREAILCGDGQEVLRKQLLLLVEAVRLSHVDEDIQRRAVIPER